MKRLLYILLVVFLFLSLGVRAQEERKEELLRELAESPGDTTRLNILYELSVVTKYQPLVRVYYLDQLIKEADKQKNDFFKCQVYLNRIFMAYNSLDAPALHYWFSLLEPLTRKNNYYDLQFQGKRCVIDFFQLSGEYEKEERESKLLLYEAEKAGSVIGMVVAIQSLGNAYIVTYRDEEALAAYEKAYALSCKIGNPALTLEIIHSVTEVVQKIKDYPKWLKYIKLEEGCINESIRHSKVNFSLPSCILMMYIHYMAYYTTIGDIDMAKYYYQLADNTYHTLPEAALYREYYARASSDYLRKSGQYEKALAQVDTLMRLFHPVSALNYNTAFEERAEILHLMGRDAEALDLLKVAKKRRDSLQIELLNTQTEQVKSIHDVYLLQQEKDRNYRYLQVIIISFLVVSIITITVFIIYTYRARRKLEHDEAEMRKMAYEVELANSAKERFLSNISTSISQPLDMVVESSLFLVSEQQIEDKQRVAISEVINKTSSDLMRLINDILDLSRLEAGMMRFVLSDVEVFSLIQDVVAGNSIESGRKINIVCPQSVLFWSHIDGTRLLNVFNNLFAIVIPGKELQVSIEVNEEETELMIKVHGTLLASQGLSQDMIIRNEINRMIINHFEGVYESRIETQTPYIYFTVRGYLTSFDQS